MKIHLVLFFGLISSCAHDMSGLYRTVSAGPTGCDADRIQIAADANPMMWTASCGEKTYQCMSPKGVQTGVAICSEQTK